MVQDGNQTVQFSKVDRTVVQMRTRRENITSQSISPWTNVPFYEHFYLEIDIQKPVKKSKEI
jgi:hypothetical protein